MSETLPFILRHLLHYHGYNVILHSCWFILSLGTSRTTGSLSHKVVHAHYDGHVFDCSWSSSASLSISIPCEQLWYLASGPWVTFHATKVPPLRTHTHWNLINFVSNEFIQVAVHCVCVWVVGVWVVGVGGGCVGGGGTFVMQTF